MTVSVWDVGRKTRQDTCMALECFPILSSLGCYCQSWEQHPYVFIETANRFWVKLDCVLSWWAAVLVLSTFRSCVEHSFRNETQTWKLIATVIAKKLRKRTEVISPDELVRCTLITGTNPNSCWASHRGRRTVCPYHHDDKGYRLGVPTWAL